MFSLISVSLPLFKADASLSAIGSFCPPGMIESKGKKTTPLPLPFIEPRSDDVFNLLAWRAELSEITGCEEAFNELEEWAFKDFGNQVSVKCILGQGGMGKTRIAAQFARELRDIHGWSAGFLQWIRSQKIPMREQGTLFVIDYPEERREYVLTFLEELANCEHKAAVRVLFLTRSDVGLEQWFDDFIDHSINAVLDPQPLYIHEPDEQEARRIFITAFNRACEIMKTQVEIIDEKTENKWLNSIPEKEKPLFLVAAAIHCAMNPDDLNITYNNKEVMNGLVRREMRRHRNTSKNYKANKYVIPRLLAMAIISGGLPVKSIEEFSLETKKLIGIPEDCDVFEILKECGLLEDDILVPLTPDIPAAAFAVAALARRVGQAPELVWQAIKHDPLKSIDTLSRIEYDLRKALPDQEHSIIKWLEEAVSGNVERCSEMIELPTTDYPNNIAHLAEVICNTLLEHTDKNEDLASLKGHLSSALAAQGEKKEALRIGSQAVNLYTQLANHNPKKFEPFLASNLNNLSLRLIDNDNKDEALQTLNQAVDLFKRLTKQNPERFEPDLASSLNNLSRLLAELDDIDGALDTITQAIIIRKRLAEENPTRFELDLASSLNNKSNLLSDLGDNASALEDISQAVEIKRRLAGKNPARFEQELASSLHNLSISLSLAGENKIALNTCREATTIYERLAEEHPARFEPKLALILHNLSLRFLLVRDHQSAINSINRSIEIYNRLAIDDPEFERSLASTYGAYGEILQRRGDLKQALAKFQAGADLVGPYADKYPISRAAQTYSLLLNNIQETQALIDQSPPKSSPPEK